MGPDEQTRHDAQAEAEAFFAQFENPSIDLLAKVWAEKFGNIHSVTAEAHGYWVRKMADRAERRAHRELAAARAQQARLDVIPTTAPTAPVPADGQPPVVLPQPRVVILTDEQRAETRAWWHRLAINQGAYTIRNRIRREIRAAEAEDRFATRANAAWRLEQRAFERAQWLAVTPEGRRRRKVANRWVAISEDQALTIALAAHDKQHPPQG